MANTTIKVIKASQRIGDFYVGIIPYRDLYEMSTVDIRHITDDDEVVGIQRELRDDKVRSIKKYLTTANASFPNSIILNVNEANIVTVTDNELILRKKTDTFTIIDGQHRLKGFEDYTEQPFDLIVTIFINLDLSKQAELFSTINSQQTKVDPSLNINLELSRKEYTPKKMLVEIAQAFNADKESPWYNRIKMTNVRDNGVISLSAFVSPLVDLTFPEKDYVEILNKFSKNNTSFPAFDESKYRMERYVFWCFYANQDVSSIYKILYNYFVAMSTVLEKDWSEYNSLLLKTTGYNAMIRLFKYLVPICVKEHNFSKPFFLDKLSSLKKLSGSINSDNYGTSGSYASGQLYNDFIELVASQM